MKSHRILSAALLLRTLAACGQNPTGSDLQAESAGASYDGGFVIGSGNSAAPAGGYTIGSGGRAEEEEGGETSTTTEDTAERGGFVIGSGN